MGWGETSLVTAVILLANLNIPSQVHAAESNTSFCDQSIFLRNITGTVRIETPVGETLIVTRGEKAREVMYGSGISVPSGKAEMTVGATRTLLDTGQIVRFTRDRALGTVQIGVAYDSVLPVRIEIGPAAVTLFALGRIGIGMDTAGSYLVTALEGNVHLITAEGDRKMDRGEVRKIDFSIKSEPSQPGVEEASPYVP